MMSGKLMALGFFIALAVFVIGQPVILWLATTRDWAIVKVIQRRPRVVHVTQAVLMSAFAVTGLWSQSEIIKWLIVGMGVVGAALAVLQAVSCQSKSS